jgi:hypothetical protein
VSDPIEQCKLTHELARTRGDDWLMIAVSYTAILVGAILAGVVLRMLVPS